jgi:hypothetical protein
MDIFYTPFWEFFFKKNNHPVTMAKKTKEKVNIIKDNDSLIPMMQKRC